MKLLPASKAAEAVGLTPWALRQGAIEGRYPHIMVGTKRMFDVDVLAETLRDEMNSRMNTCRTKTLQG